MNKIIIVAIFCMLFLTTFVVAAIVGETTITVKIYNNTIEITNSDYSGNDQTRTFEIVNNSAKYKEFSFPFIFIRNESISIDLVSKYAICLEEKAIFNTAWTKCVLDLENCENEGDTELESRTEDLENRVSSIESIIRKIITFIKSLPKGLSKLWVD